MDPLIKELNAAGFHALRVTLLGHGVRAGDKYSANADSWLLNMEQGFCEARKNYPDLPVSILGYSTGAAAAVVFLDTVDAEVEYAVFLAPAWALRGITVFVRPLRFVKSVPLPLLSLAPERYQRHRSPSPAMYSALFDLVDKVKQVGHRDKFTQVKGLVVLSRSDSLVDSESVLEWLQENVPSWKSKVIEVDGNLSFAVGHGLLDEEGVGKSAWEKIREAIKEHLAVR